MDQYKIPALTFIAPMLRYNLANDDQGNIVIVSGEAWSAAHYFAHSIDE